MSSNHPPVGDLGAEVEKLRRRVDELEAALAERGGPSPNRPDSAGSRWLELDADRILDLSGVMFVALDSNGRMVLANRTACQVLERTEEELLGANWFDTCLPSDVRESVRTTFHRIVAGGLEALEYYENPVLTRSGAIRLIAWHNAMLTASEGAIVGTPSSGLDVTEHRRAVEALRESEERFRTLFDSAQDGLLVADGSTRRLVTGNRAIRAMLGYSVSGPPG